MQINYPFCVDRRGRTASATEQEHLQELIEQVLFTAPGERVNRPSFGSGLMQMVFAPLGEELATTTQFLVQGALEQNLGDLIQVESVQVSAIDTTLQVIVQYMVRRTGQRQVAEFRREV